MKKTGRVVFVLLIIAVIALCGVYFSSPARQDDLPFPVIPDSGQTVRLIESITFPAYEYQMSVGEQLTPQADALPTEHSEVISWSSSDESIVTVDPFGTVTAVSLGEAEITASTQSCLVSIKITVTEPPDWQTEVSIAIERLANECGSGTTYIDAQLLCERLAGSQTEAAAVLHELLSAILAYSSGSGERERLIAAIDAADADDLTCLTAANACWAKHETLMSDAVLSFTGDVTLARYNESARGDRFPAVYAASGSYTYPFDRVRGLFTCDTMTVVNFEGTLTGSTSHRDKTFYFRGDPLYAGILPASSIEAAGLENNHSGDYYSTGFTDTVSYLQSAGVSAFYGGQPLLHEMNGRSGHLAIVLLGMMHTGDSIPEDELSQMLNTIRQYDTSDTVVIVNIHWGVEGDTTPSRSQQNAAHAMVDAGADLIIGHHPHVLQGIECYNGRYIAYSLGNFSFGGNGSASSPETVILRASIGSENGGPAITGISVVPCHITSSGSRVNDYQPCIRFGRNGQEVISTLLDRSAKLEYGIESVEYCGV